MTIKKTLTEKNTFYFCTFTCFQWLNLFKVTNIYDYVYDWFDILKSKYSVKTCAYVVMPNHLHLVIYIPEIDKNINEIISDSKKFMAYEIVDRLIKLKEDRVLTTLEFGVSEKDKKRGKLHQVFESSSDLKELSTLKFVGQKINYIHFNPVRKGLVSADEYFKYEYSSAGYYECDEDYKGYPVTCYTDVIDD